METNTTSKPGPLSRALFTLLLGASAILALPSIASGQIFVVNSGKIGEYTTSGATVNTSLISGLKDAWGIAVSGGELFVANRFAGTIGEYTTAGATVNASLIKGLSDPIAIAVSGDRIFVVNNNAGGENAGTIGEYTTSGATVNASLITGLGAPQSIAVSGSNLFVVNTGAASIGEYTTSGTIVNPALVTGFDENPNLIAVSGSNLFVMTQLLGTIGEYTTSGATVNASLIGGLDNVHGIAASGGNLFVTSYSTGTIGEYTTSGKTVKASLVSGLNSPLGIAVVTADYWTGTNSTNWADSGNWSGTVPGDTADTTNTDTAVFNQNAPNSPLAIDAGRNIQSISFDTASVNSLTVGAVGGQALLLKAGGTIQTTSTVVNLQTVNAPLVLEGDYTFTSGAASSAALSFGGGIAPGTTSGITTLTLNGANIGANTISGVLADNGAGQLAVTKSGTGVWILAGANTYSGDTTVLAGTLKFNVTAGTPSIAAGVTATVASGATLELTGSVSALGTAGGNRVHIVNDSTASGLVVSGTHQVVGGIDGTGNTQVNAGSDLTANHIIQNALIIGGAAGTPSMVTIDASDANGNPLGQSSGFALASSLTPSGPFGAGGFSPADLSGVAADSTDLAVPAAANSVGVGNASQVPEPSTLLLALLAVLGLVSTQFARHHFRCQTV